jgi:methylmalonyl-CoA mutase cobalamin-binding subunit
MDAHVRRLGVHAPAAARHGAEVIAHGVLDLQRDELQAAQGDLWAVTKTRIVCSGVNQRAQVGA